MYFQRLAFSLICNLVKNENAQRAYFKARVKIHIETISFTKLINKPSKVVSLLLVGN